MHEKTGKPMEQNRKARSIPFAYVNLICNKIGFLNQWRSHDLKSDIEINGQPCGKKQIKLNPFLT